MKVYKIDHEHPEPDLIQPAATIIKQGGIVAFPTHCLYGLAADAFNRDAVEQVYKVKQRPIQKPILILIEQRQYLNRLVSYTTPAAVSLMDLFWPGKVTLIFKAGSDVPFQLTAGTGKIGIRQAGHPVAAALIRALGKPITGTSANLSGESGCRRLEDLEQQLARQLDAALDAGPLKGGIGSTVVDVTGDVPRVLREGVVSEVEILTGIKI